MLKKLFGFDPTKTTIRSCQVRKKSSVSWSPARLGKNTVLSHLINFFALTRELGILVQQHFYRRRKWHLFYPAQIVYRISAADLLAVPVPSTTIGIYTKTVVLVGNIATTGLSER